MPFIVKAGYDILAIFNRGSWTLDISKDRVSYVAGATCNVDTLCGTEDRRIT
jgi:hypothetical protein